MWKTIRARIQQGYRTMRYPDGPAPDLPKHFVGRPEVDSSKCRVGCEKCTQVCPTQAIELAPQTRQLSLDTGRCLFCSECVRACDTGAVRVLARLPHGVLESHGTRRDGRLAASRRRT